MKLTIAESPMPRPTNPTSSFMVEIQSIMGDEDGYTNWAVGPFAPCQQDSLQSLLETLNRMKEAFPRGMSGNDTYTTILGFQQWFKEVATMDELKKEAWKAYDLHGEEAHQKIFSLLRPEWATQWPDDATAGYESPEQFNKYKVFYYDANGDKYEVTATW